MFNTYYPSLRYSYIDYDTVAGGDWLMGSSVRKSGSKKLPQVYICGQYIGGESGIPINVGHMADTASFQGGQHFSL